MVRQCIYTLSLLSLALILSSCQKDDSKKVTLNNAWESEYFVDIVEGEFAELKEYVVLYPDSTGLFYSPKTHTCHDITEISISNGIVLIDSIHYSYYWSDSLRFTMELLDTAGVEGYPFPLSFQPIGTKTINVCE